MTHRSSWLALVPAALLGACSPATARLSSTSGSTGSSASSAAAASASSSASTGSSGAGTTGGASTGSSGSSSSSSASSSSGGTGAALPPGYPNLELPRPGDAELRILSPTVLELVKVTAKAARADPLPGWDFVDASGQPSGLPGPGDFQVTAGGQAVAVQQVGFKRRPLYAAFKRYDLRIANSIYLVLAQPLAEGAAVSVTNPGGQLGGETFAGSADPARYGPALHVGQAGYAPALPKRAMVGFYLGSLGELPVSATTFSLVDAATGAEVFQGALAPRLDQGFSFTPAEYQGVLEADFTAFQTPGEYQLRVPGLGSSYPFRIDEGAPAAVMRTYALGLYHQRCGVAKALPYTRFVDGLDHAAPAEVPTMDPAFDPANALIASNSAVPAGQTAPQLSSVAASLYPFVRAGSVDVSGGHHDAGDYSKYVQNSGKLVHALVWAADNLPGVGALDNLGIPESGDGKSDVLQEAKWEADFLARAQDSDGAFYTLVYPRTRAYEQDVLPSGGDPQIVWPKTTLSTAIAVAALAEIGSSPRFKQQFPAEAADYLQRAQAGWAFLQSAFAAHGRAGSFQYLYQYGTVFLHDDELAWAAAALYAATGDAQYQADLLAHFPDPSDPNTFQWGWWRDWEGYGNAVRDYAFAARSGRLQAAQLDASYLAACEAAVRAAGQDQLTWAHQSAYGTSFPAPSKSYGQAGWYFSGSQAFDLAVAHALQPDPAYVDAILTNLNYATGANPLNLSFLEGIGWQRPREMVSQFFQNDRHRLPPTGIEFGNLATGFQYSDAYGSEPGALTFPNDGAAQGGYAFYDRFAHAFNVTTESVTLNEAWAFAAAAAVAAPGATQPWSAQAGQLDAPAGGAVGAPATVTLRAPGLDLSQARVTWEAEDQEPHQGGTSFTFTPTHGGPKWIEAEAMLPDGRRVVAVREGWPVVEPVPAADTIEAYNPGLDLATAAQVAAWYPLDADLRDARHAGAALAPAGAAALDAASFAWPNRPAGGALRVHDLGDQAVAAVPLAALAGGSAIRVEAMLYVDRLRAYGRSNASLLKLEANWQYSLGLWEGAWDGLHASGGLTSQSFDLHDADLAARLAPGRWHHVRLSLDASGYALEIDGASVVTAASPDLAGWPQSGDATLTVGNFDGWIDEVVISRG